MLKQTCIVAAHRGGAANGGETAAQGETAAVKGAAAGERDRAAGVAVQVEEGRRRASLCEAKQTGQTCLVVAGLRTEAELRHTEVKPRQPKARLRAREIELRERLRKARRGAGGPPTAHEPSSPSCEGIDLLRGSRMRACT